MRTGRIASVVLAAAVLLAAAPAARAGLIAATEVEAVHSGSMGLDIALVDVATGARFTLPAGVNTSLDEAHPSITPDGKRLAFERVDHSEDTRRIIVVDLATGQQADLFNAFDSSQFGPRTPTLTADGQTVLTGMNSQEESGPVEWTETSLANFPSGPFPHTIRRDTNFASNSHPRTSQPAVTPSGVVAVGFNKFLATGNGDSIVVESGGRSRMITDPDSVERPAPSDPNHVIVFERGAFGSLSRLRFRTLDAGGLPGSSTFTVSGAVDGTGDLQAHPAFSPDGRYLVFLALQPDDSTRLFAFDTGTQLLLNPSGVDVGALPFVGLQGLDGNMSVRATFVLGPTRVALNGSLATVSFLLNQSFGVGILVQRIVGHHQLLGRRVPRLRTIGRVPFGRFARGHRHVSWHLRVNGKRLRPGKYLVTARALTRKGVVSELGKPHRLTVH